MRRIRIIAGLTLLLVVTALLASFVTLLLATRPTNRILWQQCQPDTVVYDDFGYCITLLEGAPEYNGYPLTIGRRYRLLVARGTQTTYGHAVDYALTHGHDDAAAYAQRSSAEWTPEGVTYIEPDGHRVFFPAAVFTGGR
jgi:hypothetical protein